MNAIVARRVSRAILVAFPLTLLACKSANESDLQTAGVGGSADAEHPTSVIDDPRPVEVSDFARQAEARTLVDDQYRTIRDWLRRNELKQRSHSELVSMAKTDAAAARYIECHESSNTPTGTDTRLGLLSACLTADPNANLPAETTPASATASTRTAAPGR